MITAVDTNILIDIFGADPDFGRKSAKALKQCMDEGALYACDIVWSETATAFKDTKLFLTQMNNLGIEFSPMTKEATIMAAQAWRKYRESGGKRQRIVADFLIGAHAAVQCDRLLTRDRGFYRLYFKTIKLKQPK